jgi:hypothetical protein
MQIASLFIRTRPDGSAYGRAAAVTAPSMRSCNSGGLFGEYCAKRSGHRPLLLVKASADSHWKLTIIGWIGMSLKPALLSAPSDNTRVGQPQWMGRPGRRRWKFGQLPHYRENCSEYTVFPFRSAASYPQNYPATDPANPPKEAPQMIWDVAAGSVVGGSVWALVLFGYALLGTREGTRPRRAVSRVHWG